MGAIRRGPVAAAAGLALADASIVALALPQLLAEMDTTITGLAAIVGVYALVLAVALLPAAGLVRRHGADRVGAWGCALFAAASVGCAAAPSLPVLLLFRALQAAGGAGALLGAFHVLDAGASAHGRRLWLGAALAGTAAGPAVGGVLTEAFDWRAIFAVQAPVAAVAAVACLRPAAAGAPAAPGGMEAAEGGGNGAVAGNGAAGAHTAGPLWAGRPAVPGGATAAPAQAPALDATAGVRLVSLALIAAGFTAVLFLLVIELVAGFATQPLKAALAVTVLPLAALAAGRVGGSPLGRAVAGGVLIAGGAAALAFVPGPALGWAVLPQVLAGAGMGLAIPAFAGELLPERTVPDAARLLVARHAGIVLVLALLAPVATHRLDTATDAATLQGAALVLDARLPPLEKLDLAPALLAGVGGERPRGGLREAVERRRPDFPDQPAEYDRLASRLDGVVVRAIQDAFRVAYLIAAALSLLGAALLVPRARVVPVVAAGLVAAACTAGYAIEAHRRAPPEVVLQDPCRPRPLPSTGGITGAIQDAALRELDRAACRVGATREELALALADRKRSAAFERRYGVNPRSVSGLLGLLGG